MNYYSSAGVLAGFGFGFEDFKHKHAELITNIKHGEIFKDEEITEALDFFENGLQKPAVSQVSIRGLKDVVEVSDAFTYLVDFEFLFPLLRIDLTLPKNRVEKEFKKWLNDAYDEKVASSSKQDPIGTTKTIGVIKDNQLFPLMDLLICGELSETNKQRIGELIFENKVSERAIRSYAQKAIEILRDYTRKSWF
jgi:hypothetical protein